MIVKTLTETARVLLCMLKGFLICIFLWNIVRLAQGGAVMVQKYGNAAARGAYILFFLSLLLPWFTYNASVMGYCWGTAFAKWYLIPLFIFGMHLFVFPDSKPMLALSKLCIAAFVCIYIFAFGRWQEVCNISSGFQWSDGLHTAMPTFWISAAVFSAFSVIFLARPSTE